MSYDAARNTIGAAELLRNEKFLEITAYLIAVPESCWIIVPDSYRSKLPAASFKKKKNHLRAGVVKASVSRLRNNVSLRLAVKKGFLLIRVQSDSIKRDFTS